MSAQTRTATAPYQAVTDRVSYPKPALPALGPAGSTFRDPVFKSVITRVTDATTRPGAPNRSYRTPSSPHQNAWSAKSSYFYVAGSGGVGAIPFAFDPVTGTARRIQASGSGDGGMTLKFYIEPQFSYVDDAIIYGSYNGAGSTKRTIDQYDFTTGAYTSLFDLDTIVSGLSGTYIGGIASSGGPVERIMALFGGASQDRHRYVVVFDRANAQNRQIVDTIASTINGLPSPVWLGFNLHHAAIDRSGRFVMLYPTGADQAAPRSAAQEYLWDLQTGRVTELGTPALPYGHDAFGYGVYVNKDCCTSTTWDAGQWQFRTLASPLGTRDLVKSVLRPEEIFLADHTTWNNARADRLVPVVSATYRHSTNTAPWRAWDDEIVAIQTDAAPAAESTIWRFAHHRSDVTYDGDPSRLAFWYQPRPNVSQDGRWVLFTSNWEKTLGTDPAPEAGTAARQDVFLVEMAAAGAGTPEVTNPNMSIDAPGPNAVVPQSFSIAGWAVDTGSTRDSGIDAVHVWAFPNPGSNQAPVFLGVATYGVARSDIAAALGPQFVASGFALPVNGLAPGVYQIAVFAHSRIADAFNDMRLMTFTVAPPRPVQPRMSIDTPGNGGASGKTFAIAGWALDASSRSGSGVDAVHVWAQPNPGSGEAPRFVGEALLGFARPDVAAAFGPAGAASGYYLAASLPAGVYDLVVFARNTVTGTFNNALTVRVTIR